MAEVHLEVTILNLTYTVVGFEAIKELKAWLDENASDAREADGPPQPVVGG